MIQPSEPTFTSWMQVEVVLIGLNPRVTRKQGKLLKSH